MTTLHRLAEFATATGLDDVPEAVLVRGRWILADTLGCMAAGNRVVEVRALAGRHAARGGRAEAEVIGTAVRLPREAAAEVNGAAATWLDLDEGNLHTKGHAGSQLIPAALAEAQAEGLSGAALLRAVILGYEIGCRVYGATDVRLAVHPHGTYGPLAAAASLACLRGLDAAAMAGVMGLAAGLGVVASRQTLRDGATIRNAYSAASARAAFHVFDLAACGFSGERDPLVSVFGALYGTGFDAERCVAGLGADWLMLRNYFKLHPSVRYAHSALDLVDDLRAGHVIAADDVVRIDFESYFMATTLADPVVTTAFGTRFSIPFLVAARLLDADVDITADGSALLARADIHALALRVSVREEVGFTELYPARQASRLRIWMADGRCLVAEADFMRGEAERPHRDADLAAKFSVLWPAGDLGRWLSIDSGAV
jgi:2-methylcitrate dehydratase PrpD